LPLQNKSLKKLGQEVFSMPMSGDEFVEWLDRELEPLRREASSSPYFDAWCSGKLTSA